MEKIMYLINNLETGGAQKAMARICGELKRDYKMRVVGLIDGDRSLVPELIARSIPYEVIGFRKSMSDTVRIGRVNREIRDFRPDILICSLYHSSALGSLLGRVNGIEKIISWEHSADLGNWQRRLIKRLIDRLAWKIFCDSKTVYDAYNELTGSKKSVLVPIGGLDTSVFKPAKRQHEGIVAASVGGLLRDKGYDLLLESARQLVADVPGIQIRIAAVGPEGDELERRIREYGLEKNVFLDGLVEDVPEYLAKADIYVQPSRVEGQCIAVVEAMACGLPILGARTAGILESVEEGVNGFLADPADAKAWNEKMKLLIQDERLRATMGVRSREIAVNKYDIRNTIKLLERELSDGEQSSS